MGAIRWDRWDRWDKWEIPIERSVTHQAKRSHLSYAPAHLNQHTDFSSEVPRFGTKSKLHWKGVYYAYISFQGNELGSEDWCLSREINLLLEGLQMWP